MKKYLKGLFLVLLIIPSIATASWWNPFSWKEKAELSTIQILPENSDNSKVLLESTEQEESKPQVSKIVEKVITVDNPVLQKQINDLVAENVALKQEIQALNVKINELNKVSNVKIVTPDCFYTIKAVAKDDIFTLPAQTIVSIHAESNCEIENKNISIKTYKVSQQEKTLVGTSSSISILGSLKEKDKWVFDTTYNTKFTLTGNHVIDFILEGQRETITFLIKG